MKKFLIIIFIWIAVPIAAYTQDHGSEHCGRNKEQIQSQKIAYITDKLDLSVSEAQQFWPVYNEFSNKNSELFEEQRSINRNLRHNKDNLSDEEQKQMITRILEINIKQAQLEKEYYEKYSKVLSNEKIVLLYQAEFSFRRQLLRRFKSDRDRDGN